MQISIQARGFALTEALREHVLRRARIALAHCAPRIRRVAVRMGDINGPRGGIDKSCRIEVRLDHAPVSCVEDTGADLYQVIDRAMARSARRVGRRIERAHTRARAGEAGVGPSGRTLDREAAPA